MSTLATDGVVDLHLFSEVLMGGEEPGLFVACLTPRSRGRLRLHDADPAAAPLLDHGFLTDEEGHDLAVLSEGVEHARRFLAMPPMAALFVRGARTRPGRRPRRGDPRERGALLAPGRYLRDGRRDR